MLRPQLPEDLPVLTGGASPFDDFGPTRVRSAPADCDLEVNGASSCPMIGVWLCLSHRGKGVGYLAQRQLVELRFAHTRAHRIEAHTDVENLAEQRSSEKAGRREGVVRGGQWRDGMHRDGVLYAVLRTDVAPGRG